MAAPSHPIFHSPFSILPIPQLLPPRLRPIQPRHPQTQGHYLPRSGGVACYPRPAGKLYEGRGGCRAGSDQTRDYGAEL